MKPIAAGRLVMRIRPAILASAVKRLLRMRRIELGTAEGRFWIDPGSYLGLTLLEDGAYEPDMTAALKRFLLPGGTFVDVGANEGYFTVIGSRLVGAGGRVLAIEPQARLQSVLEANLRLNACRNVAVAAVAVSDRAGSVRLHLAPGVNNSASGLERPTRYRLARQTVACATLEEVLAERGLAGCDLAKIDIEGWEHEAVLGSPRLFRERRVRAVALECHPELLARRGLDPKAVPAFLAGCGYARAAGPDGLELFHAP